MPHRSIAHPPRFVVKLATAALLVALADWLFFDRPVGATLGGFALVWVGALVLATRPQRLASGTATALLAAALFGVVLIDDPSLLTTVLFLTAIASAALLRRTRFDDAARWIARLVTYGLLAIPAPLRDLRRFSLVSDGSHRAGSIAGVVALPLIGGAVFVALFAGANPLIGNAIASIELPGIGTLLPHLLFWSIALVLIWPSLRPRAIRLTGGLGHDVPALLPDVPTQTLTLSLLTFNAIFAVQSVLDIAFLWSGAPLPAGVTMADYAHRGAYALIATALLAGLFVLVALRPDSAGARSAIVRRLVIAWVAQNLLLVASSMLRTLDYVAAYSLTELRIAALAWMALVGVGLVLICWRMLAGRSAAWLINANAAAAALVLTAASMVDLGATAAAWNVRHARSSDAIDLCYLGWLDDSALLPLIELERRAGGPRLRDRATWLRARAVADLAARQGDWHSWTWRGSRRLATARAALGPTPATPRPAPYGRECDGRLRVPPTPPKTPISAPAANPPLTQAPQR